MKVYYKSNSVLDKVKRAINAQTGDCEIDYFTMSRGEFTELLNDPELNEVGSKLTKFPDIERQVPTNVRKSRRVIDYTWQGCDYVIIEGEEELNNEQL